MQTGPRYSDCTLLFKLQPMHTAWGASSAVANPPCLLTDEDQQLLLVRWRPIAAATHEMQAV
jgi:hypothetical protein